MALRRLRALAGALPPGTIGVGLGLGILGLAAYVFLAIAGHSLADDTSGMNSVSALWAFVFAIGPGLFLPLEQELARVVADRTHRGVAPGAVVVRVAGLAGAFLAVILLLLGAGSGWVAREFFAGNRLLTIALAVNLIALACAHLTRGVLAGTGRFARYGVQLAVDGSLRGGFAAALWLSGHASPASFGFALALAQILGVVVTSVDVVRMRSGPSARWQEISAGLGLLLVYTLLSQVVVNVGVVIAQVLSGPGAALSSDILKASVLARTPLFVYAALQASLLPSLARAVSADSPAAYRRGLSRAVSAVLLLGLAGLVLCATAGPTLSRWVFHARGVLTAGDFSYLSAGTAVFLVAMVLGQGLIALGLHRVIAIAWLVGFAVLAAITIAPLSVAVRVEAGYTFGGLAAAAVMATSLARHPSVRADGPVGLGAGALAGGPE